MREEDYINANIEAWEEAADLHRERNMEQLLARIGDPNSTFLDAVDIARLNALEVAGKDVAQVCCNNGRELISVKRLGAARCVGFDGAAGFVHQAQELNVAAGSDCEFVQTDIHKISNAYDGAFDIAYITIGVIGWMPELDPFFASVARLIRPGGALFIHEQHPIIEMVEPGAAGDPVSWDYSYFKKDPWAENDGLDYYGNTKFESKTRYSFPHTMAEIIMGCVNNGLAIEFFEEYPTHISNTWYNIEKQGPELPMSYALVGRKKNNPPSQEGGPGGFVSA